VKTVLLIALVWGVFIVARLTAPKRVVTMEEKVAKLREQSYARWYAAQIRGPLYDFAPTDRIQRPYAPHRAVNLLPSAVSEW